MWCWGEHWLQAKKIRRAKSPRFFWAKDSVDSHISTMIETPTPRTAAMSAIPTTTSTHQHHHCYRTTTLPPSPAVVLHVTPQTELWQHFWSKSPPQAAHFQLDSYSTTTTTNSLLHHTTALSPNAVLLGTPGTELQQLGFVQYTDLTYHIINTHTDYNMITIWIHYALTHIVIVSDSPNSGCEGEYQL